MRGDLKLGFLVCPPEGLIHGFVHRPADLDPDLVRAVSGHLGRCAPCREEADRLRRGQEAAGARRPWLWTLLAVMVLGAATALFLWHEPRRPAAGGALRLPFGPGGREAAARPDPRISTLARFEPPSDAILAAAVSGSEPPPPLSPEDHRELAAARSRMQAEGYADAARLLEDLASRHPDRGGLRLLLAYAYARTGEFELAHRQYAIAHEQGVGLEACWGLVNASLRLGDVAAARDELAHHLLARRPDHERARDLMGRINAAQLRSPR